MIRWTIFLAPIALAFFHDRHFRFELALTFAIYVLLLIVYEGSRVLFAAWRRAAIQEVGLFFGSALICLRWSGVKFRVNCIPSGSYVKFYGFDPPVGQLAFPDLNRGERIGLHLVPIVAMATVAALLLGPLQMAHFLGDFFTHGLVRAIHPRTECVPVVTEFFRHLASRPQYAAGKLAVILLALNFIFIVPALLLEASTGKPAPRDRKNFPRLVLLVWRPVMIATLLCMASWGVAVVMVLFGR